MRVFSATDIGQIRSVNQDFIFTSADPVGNLPNLFVVADGMGGHAAGDYASHFAVTTLVETVKKDENFNPVRIIRNGMAAANAGVIDAASNNPELAGMGTTMVAATLSGSYLYVANVGDSRLYIANEELTQITQDHSLIAEMVRLGELPPEEAEHHPDKNIITRAIGTNNQLQIDFFDFELQKGTVFLMCSDGLTNMVSNKDILRIVKENINKAGADPAQALVDEANKNGGLDNIAVVVVDPFGTR